MTYLNICAEEPFKTKILLKNRQVKQVFKESLIFQAVTQQFFSEDSDK